MSVSPLCTVFAKSAPSSRRSALNKTRRDYDPTTSSSAGSVDLGAHQLSNRTLGKKKFDLAAYPDSRLSYFETSFPSIVPQAVENREVMFEELGVM